MKHRLQKWLALLLATALLCCLIPFGATAEAIDPKELMSLVGTSRSEVHAKANDGSEVVALAFRYRVDTTGLEYGAGRKTVTDNATVNFGDTTYHLVRMGALMCNKVALGENPSAFVIGASGTTHIPAAYLFALGRNYGEFVARIVNIPVAKMDALIYARPYFVYEDENGAEKTVYGDIDSANASGKKVRYAVEIDSLSWSAGTLSAEDGLAMESAQEIRTDYINNTDLLIRLPELANGTPTAYVRAYYYSADEFLGTMDVKENWTVLKDLGIPSGAVAVRLAAYAADGSAIDSASALGKQILVTANKKGEMLPLLFQKGGLSDETGAEVEGESLSRTDYLAVRDLLVRPGGGSTFMAYFYNGAKEYLGCTDFYMSQAKKLLKLAPAEAAYVRFAVHYVEPVEEEEEEESSDPAEPLVVDLTQEESLLPMGMAYFYAYLTGTVSYNDFAYEADQEETKPTQPTEPSLPSEPTTPTEPTNPSEPGSSVVPGTTTGSTSTTTTTTKPTTSTTKPTTSTTKPTTKPTQPDGPLVLTDDKPENQGVQNALWNMEQLVKITYTPLKVIPQNLSDYPAKVTQMGIPYSSSKIEQGYVPNNVSFHTFMTALQNPNSYLYTVDLGEDYGNKNGDTYYGAVCSSACGYALGIVGNYTTYQWTQIPGMSLLPKQDLRYLKLCDTIVGQGHVVLITGITRDQNGNIVKVHVSEAAGLDVHAGSYTITALEERFPASLYEYCRYSNLKNVTYTPSEYVAVGKEKAQTVSYNKSIIPRKGDKANWRTDETVILDVLNKGKYTQVEIYRNGKVIKTLPIASVIKLTDKIFKEPGRYRARLLRDGGASKSCYWYVTDAQSQAELYQGTRKVKVSFSASNAEPLYVQWMNGATNSTIRITPLTEEQKKAGYGIFIPARGDLKVRVAFQTEYGVIYSELPEIITVK